jgi:hypothetical protein
MSCQGGTRIPVRLSWTGEVRLSSVTSWRGTFTLPGVNSPRILRGLRSPRDRMTVSGVCCDLRSLRKGNRACVRVCFLRGENFPAVPHM